MVRVYLFEELLSLSGGRQFFLEKRILEIDPKDE